MDGWGVLWSLVGECVDQKWEIGLWPFYLQHTDVPEVAHTATLFLACLWQIINTRKLICWNFLFNFCHTCEKRKKFEAHFRDQSMREVHCCLVSGKWVQITLFQTYTGKWQKMSLGHICLVAFLNYVVQTGEVWDSKEQEWFKKLHLSLLSHCPTMVF